MMLLLYVDDLFLTGKEELIKDARRRLATEFEMKDLGIMHYFLGMEGERRTFQQSSSYRILVSSDPRWIHKILVAEEAICHCITECFNT